MTMSVTHAPRQNALAGTAAFYEWVRSMGPVDSGGAGGQAGPSGKAHRQAGEEYATGHGLAAGGPVMAECFGGDSDHSPGEDDQRELGGGSGRGEAYSHWRWMTSTVMWSGYGWVIWKAAQIAFLVVVR